MSRPISTHCKDCKAELTAFNSYYVGRSRGNRCKSCYAIWRKKFKNSEKLREYVYQRDYGISTEDYDKLLELHQGVCAICRKKCSSGHRLSIDHNHGNKEIRGLLCKNCNVAVGFFEDEEFAWKVLEYLKRTTWSKVS